MEVDHKELLPGTNSGPCAGPQGQGKAPDSFLHWERRGLAPAPQHHVGVIRALSASVRPAVGSLVCQESGTDPELVK